MRGLTWGLIIRTIGAGAAEAARTMPSEDAPDSTLALACEGERFIPDRCKRLRSDVFEVRLSMQRTICMSGPDAARVFWDPERFRCVGGRGDAGARGSRDVGAAQPAGENVARLLLSEPSLGQLADRCAWEWDVTRAAPPGEWLARAQLATCRAVCGWLGLALESRAPLRRARWLCHASSAPLWISRGIHAALLRRRIHAWLARAIRQSRAAPRTPGGDDALTWLAASSEAQADDDGLRAARTLFELGRPFWALSPFLAWAALALAEQPQLREWLAAHPSEDALDAVAREIQRFYPVQPLAAARVRREFVWRGYTFPAGRRVLFDVYGTNHDARYWAEPERFEPRRFRRALWPFDGTASRGPWHAHAQALERAAWTFKRAALRAMLCGLAKSDTRRLPREWPL